MDKPTYRRGLQAVQCRGEFVTELLQDHGYCQSGGIAWQGRVYVCVLCRAACLLPPHVTRCLLLWPCLFCVVCGWRTRRHE